MTKRTKIITFLMAIMMLFTAIAPGFAQNNVITAEARNLPASSPFRVALTQWYAKDGSNKKGVYLHTSMPTNQSTFISTRAGIIPNGSLVKIVATKSGYAVDGTHATWYQIQYKGVNSNTNSTGYRYWIYSECCETASIKFMGYCDITTSTKLWRDGGCTEVVSTGLKGVMPMYYTSILGDFIILNNKGGTTGAIAQVEAIEADITTQSSKGGTHIYVTGSSVYMRQYPMAWSSSGSNGQYVKGRYYTIMQRVKNSSDGKYWYKVQTGSSTYSWIRSDCCKAVTLTGNRVKATATVNIRAGAGTGYSKLATIYSGNILRYISTKTVSGVTWYKVQYKYGTTSNYGWVQGSYVSTLS